MPPRSDRPATRWPVLSIGTDRVEWFDGRGAEPLYLANDVDEPTPVRLARAALRLLRENKVRRRPCVLALGHGMLQHRTVTIADLPGKDARRVLHRKAANLIDAPLSDALYAALPMAREELEDGETAGQEWLLVATRRREARALQFELRRLGLKVVRVVSARLSKVAAAASLAESADEATVGVGAGSQSVTISLVTDGELVQQTTLKGAYQANPSMASSLLQELRSFEAFWRRRSRGGQLRRVVLVGFTADQATQLSPAVHAALPGTLVEAFPEAESPDLPHDRVAGMMSALALGDLQVDLSIPLPPRAPRLVAMAMLTTAAVAALAWKGREHLLERTAERRSAVQDLRRSTTDAAQVDRDYALVEGALAALDAERGRFAVLRSHGVEMRSLIADTVAAFRGRAGLISLTVEAAEAGGRVVFTGVTTPDPGRSLAALRALAADLEASAHFAEVALTPPTGMPGGDGGGEALLEFAIDAVWEGGR